jgi:hypothetical protein
MSLGQRRHHQGALGAPTRRAAIAGLAGVGIVGATAARAATRISFADIISEDGVFTDRAQSIAGQEIEIRGYMAPPLKPEIRFFVLTKLPAAVCPFCDAAAAWPNDIVLVQMARPIHAVDYDLLLRVTGTLDLGVETDETTGFVSKVRVTSARYVKA